MQHLTREISQTALLVSNLRNKINPKDSRCECMEKL